MWATIILALVAAIVVAVREARAHVAPTPVPAANFATSPSATHTDLKNTGNLVIGEKAGVTIINQPPPTLNPFHQLPAPPRDFTGREARAKELFCLRTLSRINSGQKK